MRVLDLSHRIEEAMPAYPGTQSPILSPASSYARDGFRETLVTMLSHTGTHMDAPAHLFPGAKTLDQFPADRFVGRALAIDCRDLAEGQTIPLARVLRHGAMAREADFLLFCLGWDRRWGTSAYFGDYPCVETAVLDFALETGKKGLGFDTASIDSVSEAALSRHRRLLCGDVVILENLKNLERCLDEPFWLFALPLPLAGADGAPVRAVAFWED